MGKARAERWWWLGAFLVLSVLIHVLLALHGPGFGLKGAAPSPKEIELTLEALPPKEKPPAPRPKVAARPKPLPKVVQAPPKVAKAPPKVEKRPVPKAVPKPTPKVAAKPAVKPLEETPVARAVPQAVSLKRLAQATPAVPPAAGRPAPTVTPETPPTPAEPVKMASVTPRLSRSHTLLDRANPLAGLVTPDDAPETAPSARTDTPKIARSAAAHPGPIGGASGGGHGAARGAQTQADLPQDSGLVGGRYSPKVAARVGGESVLSVPNPLAEDAVPEEKPGFSAGGAGLGRGRGGLDGRRLASLRGGQGPGLGGGLGRGVRGGTGRGSGRGRGAGASDSGGGSDVPAGGEGYGRPGGGSRGAAGGRVVAGGGAAFGGVGGLLRGEPARTAGDGTPGTNGHGLSAEIYGGQPYLSRLIGHRTDATIDFNWGTTAAVIPGASRIFSVRWSGKLQPRYSETYTFASQEDDGLKLWVDGQLLITDWQDHSLTARRGSLRLDAGRKYDIRIEYFNGPRHAANGPGHAEVHLRWSSPSQPGQIVPEGALWQE